jgi:hypothetical protein
VLLFGPLKSGKSTLINALSGGYVSEVTSLPAYPCMVYLKYGPEASYSIIRYSGKRESVDSPEALKDLLDQSHRTLSERIRALDDFGESFDPAVHLPSAIRRVFVELPVDNLRDSGTVLVDTPGLYSKMKFGYDYMTQEFRDSAACAVFVVKTDNLFLEQVFSDFNDLLDQFSRVFVVVNIDTGKSDLRPDGSLEPSLESREPEQIVKAFEVLTMSAPLRRAAESGRLHIYPVDLRSAAAQRLKGEEVAGGDRFDNFLDDLTGYLNSSDYIQEFVADTLRQARKQCDNIRALCGPDSLEQLESRRGEWAQALEAARRHGEAAARLRQFDWRGALAQRIADAGEQRAQSRTTLLEQLRSGVTERVGEWLDSDQSLQQLAETVSGELAQGFAAHSETAAGALAALSASPHGGAEPGAEQLQDLEAIGLSLAPPAAPAGEAVPAPPDAPRLEAQALEALPVSRGLTDRLLFRSAHALRRRLMPDAAAPIASQEKHRRFAAGAGDFVCNASAGALLRSMEALDAELYGPAEQAYVERFCAVTDGELKAREKAFAAEQDSLEARLASLDTALAQLGSLAGVCERVAGAVSGLTERQSFVEIAAAAADPAPALEAEDGVDAVTS